MVVGKLMVSKFLQPSKATSSVPSFSVTVVRPVQPLKSLEPISLIEPGMFTDASAVQL